MPTVTLAAHCHARDLHRLHAPGVLEELIAGHNFNFDEILVIHQRCGVAINTGNGRYITDVGLEYQLPADDRIKVYHILEENYPDILGIFGIPHKDPALSEITHGWNWQWYYEHHCVNHCKEILSATSDYIIFNDADCRIKSQPEGESWVTKAIQILEGYPEVLVVAPSDGGHEFVKMLPDGTRLTLTSSQQLFMGKTSKLREMDFTNLQWDGKFDAPYGPMQEFYGMFESWLWRWMRAHGLYRAILPEQFRYWHEAWH